MTDEELNNAFGDMVLRIKQKLPKNKAEKIAEDVKKNNEKVLKKTKKAICNLTGKLKKVSIKNLKIET